MTNRVRKRHFSHPPELMWKVISALTLYEEFVERTTVSVYAVSERETS